MRLAIGCLGVLCGMLGTLAHAAEPRPELCQAFIALAAAATAQHRTIKVRVVSGPEEKACWQDGPAERQFCSDALPSIGMEFRDNYPTALVGCLIQSGVLAEARRDGGSSGLIEMIEVAPYRFEERVMKRLTQVSGELSSGELLSMTITPVDSWRDAFDLEVRPAASREGVAPTTPQR